MPNQSINTLSILIPAYNEERTIHLILEKVMAVNLGAIKKEIIIGHNVDWLCLRV